SLSYRQTYCPKSCANSGCGPATTTTAAPGTNTTFTENANCKKWATSATNFCGSADIKDDQKKAICKTTCEKEIAKTDACVLYSLKGTAVTRMPPAVSAPTTTTIDAATADTKIVSVYAKDKCEVLLLAIATTPVAEGIKFTGTATVNFFKVAAANQGSLKYTCTCTP
ncbi:hypothetical protein PFISCL1PPCAC_28203, partial [Pristionchus fissidentatus]